MVPHRLRAPKADGALLAEPPLDEASDLLAANAGRLDAWEHDFQGRSTSRLRSMVRREVLGRARAFLTRFDLDPDEALGAAGELPDRLVLTGHQPELFHPGVWAKNFALSAIARSTGTLALNLIIDNDIPKNAAIRVPVETQNGLRAAPIEFDEWAGEVPYEDWKVQNEIQFATFADRAREALGGRVADPLLDMFWPHAMQAAEPTDRVGLRFAAARRAVEASWGVTNAEVPWSAVCETEGFLWFASHLLAHLPRFQEIHNSALERYRELYGIRSRHHPVPDLRREEDWLEAPFWVWRASAPRRRPLLARQVGDSLILRVSGESDPLLELPLSPQREACCAVERLRELPARQVRLRTRALTTTLFSRLLLGDLFLHGIGGAKYDELGDEIIRGFYGIEPPAYMTLSMTLWLDLERSGATVERLRQMERRRRDLTFNPDRHLKEPISPDVQELVAAKRRAIDGPTETRRQRVARYREIRRINESLQRAVADARETLTRQCDQLSAGLRRNAVAQSREYALVLHSEHRLREALTRVLPARVNGEGTG